MPYMTSMTWEELEDHKDAIFFIELARDYSIFYTSAIASELGGYIHILDTMGKLIYSYSIKDRKISIVSMSSLVRTSHVSSWAMLECRLEGDHEEAEYTADSKQEEEDKCKRIAVRSATGDEVELNIMLDESHLLNITFHVLEMIMEFCVGVEYLNFRATCKRCRLAAPSIQWNNKTTLRRLQTYSLVSPWLMVLEKHHITFTDPMFGDKYFMKTPQELIGNFYIHCSRCGWLLMSKVGGSMVFFNPFTRDIRKLPCALPLASCYFSAPPTSPDCMVVGFVNSLPWRIYIHFVAQEPNGRIHNLNFGGDYPYSLSFPTYHSSGLYALGKEGELYVFKDLCNSSKHVAESLRSCCRSKGRYYQMICDQHLLLVIVSNNGESIEVFKLNDSKKEWEKIDNLGRYMIYICDTTCLCIKAKTPDMENKIYFPRLHPNNGYIVFYSLETSTYHTFNVKNVEERLKNFLGTTHHGYPHVWIDPSWA